MLNDNMSTSRIYLPLPITAGEEISVSGEQAHYLNRVLRLRVGDTLTVFDGNGLEHPADITEIGKRQVRVVPGQAVRRDVESPLAVHLVQAISRGERMDFSVQKATELGVSRITPVLSDRSIVRLGSDRAAKRQKHWSKIVQGACEQCGRNTVPQIDMPQPLSDWLDQDDASQARRIVLKPGAEKSIASLPVAEHGVILLVGPEGGFSDMEYQKAEFRGFQTASMGPRVLRTETAAVAALAVLQASCGDFR
jgi:16S rRNA (uracil1498-N3)-methyltransferase